MRKIILSVFFLILIFLGTICYFHHTSTIAEYAYILAAKEGDSHYSIIAYNIDKEKHSLIKTDSYPIKDDLPDQLLTAAHEGDYLTLHSIHNGKKTIYKENIYCPGIEYTIAYMDSYVYYARRNWFGLYDIVRISPDGTLFQYAMPGDGLYIHHSAKEGPRKIPHIADVDKEGRIVYSVSGSGLYLSNLSGDCYHLDTGFCGIWMNQETVLFWSDRMEAYFPDMYKYSLSDKSSSCFFKPVFKDIKQSTFSSTYTNASIKDENTISIACEIYPTMYPIIGYPKLSFGLFNSETGKCISQYNIREKDLDFCDYKIYWE